MFLSFLDYEIKAEVKHSAMIIIWIIYILEQNIDHYSRVYKISICKYVCYDNK